MSRIEPISPEHIPQISVASSFANVKHDTEARTLSEAIKLLLISGAPLLVMYLIQISTKNISIHFLKFENSDIVIGAYGLGVFITWIVFQGLFIALNTGLLSRFSQAYGANDFPLLGLYLHRGIINNFLLSIPVTALLLYSENILLYFEFDPKLAELTGKFNIVSLPGLYGLMIANTLTFYLNSADIFFIPAVFQSIASVCYWIAAYYLISVKGTSIVGAANAMNVMGIVSMALFTSYVFIKNPIKGTLFWFNRHSFVKLWELFQQQLMVGSMMFVAWIFNFLQSFLCGKLSAAELAAWAALNNNTPLGYTLAIALADVTLTYMGNSMGENQVEKAKLFLKGSLIITGVGVLLVMLIYFFFSYQIAEFYLSDPVAIDYTVGLFTLFLAIWPADCMQMIMGSGLRAIGKEKAGFLTNLCALYFVGAPLSYYLTFTLKLSVYGLLAGTIIGDYIIFIVYLIIYARLDWKHQNRVVLSKIRRDHLESKSEELEEPIDEITEQLI